MVASVNPPPLQVPPTFLKDKLAAAFFAGLIQTIYQLWTTTFQIRTTVRATTTDASITSIYRTVIDNNRTMMITAKIVARRTGGAGAGTIGDSAWYELAGCYKNIGGVLTGVGSPTLTGGEDVAAWNVGFTTVGSEAVVTVLGEAAVNITWIATVSTYDVGA